jgi:predicted nucleotidyltransferase
MSRDEQILLMIRQCLSAFGDSLKGHQVLLIGSRANGKARPRSDFDLGVIGHGSLPLKTFYEIEDALEKIPTLYRIDWVDLNGVSDQFRRIALFEGKVLYG